MNYKLTLQYDGTEFHGWQLQNSLRTVQGELTRALSLIDGRDITVHGSGRTDAGVHAEGQVANAVLERAIRTEKLRLAINANVDQDLRVFCVEEVGDEFHARYSAVQKTYRYRIINSHVVSPFWVRYAHQESRALDLDAMKASAKLFLGKHDWTAFSAAQSDVEDRVRTVSYIDVSVMEDSRARSQMIEITVTADGFLRYMVRALSGALLAIGRHEIDESELAQAVETGVRSLSIVTAPARGLTLLSVAY